MTNFNDISAERLEKAANMIKAIAHPSRLAILGYLSENEELNVSKIHELLKIEQSSASHHLGILKNKEIVVSRREGKSTFYSISNKKLENLIECISECACTD